MSDSIYKGLIELSNLSDSQWCFLFELILPCLGAQPPLHLACAYKNALKLVTWVQALHLPP